MSEVVVRPARRGDLARITEIYNHYVVNTPITFDIEPLTVEQRVAWLEEHAGSGRYRLLVAEQSGGLLGYAGTGRFRDKAAYDPSVEMTIYCGPEAVGRAIGTRLYSALFEQLKGEDIHRALAGITLPNDASVALHRKFGFKEVAHFSQNGRKLGRYWDVLWMEKAMG